MLCILCRCYRVGSSPCPINNPVKSGLILITVLVSGYSLPTFAPDPRVTIATLIHMLHGTMLRRYTQMVLLDGPRVIAGNLAGGRFLSRIQTANGKSEILENLSDKVRLSRGPQEGK